MQRSRQMSLKDMFTKEDDEKEAPKSEQDKAERVSKPGERYSENELMVRLKFIIGCSLAFTLIGIVFTVLYSIMFVTQPLNAISPIDQKFFELIIPVATFLCGTLSGIMLAGTGKEAAMAGAKAAGLNGNGGVQMQQRPITNNMSYGQQNMMPPPMNRPMQSGMMSGGVMNASTGEDLDLLPGQSPKMHE